MTEKTKINIQGNHLFNFDQNSLTVGVGDYKIAKDGYKLKTLLGCCVCICLYYQKKKIGGMLHAMLPSAPSIKKANPAKYVDSGIREMLHIFKKKYGADEKMLEAKIFGGAKMIPDSTQDIGKKNIKKARQVLKEYNIKILKQKVGGNNGYRIEFDTATGLVTCQIFGEKEEKY